MGRTLGALALTVTMLLSALAVTVPTVGAQGNKGGTSAAAKVCHQGGFQYAYTMVGGVPVGFANAGDCVSAAARGAQLGTSFFTGTPTGPDTASFSGEGLFPGADVIGSVLRANGTTSVAGVLRSVSPDGTVGSFGWTLPCTELSNVVALTASTVTASGAPISATVDVAGCAS
jgi:hypothetical protein